MKWINSIKRLNITFVFSEPLNHILINSGKIVQVFAGSGENQEKYNSIQAPNFFVLQLQESQKEIAFEKNRVILSDKSGVEPKKSDLSEMAEKVFSETLAKLENISAEGYNFDLEITYPDEEVASNFFLSKKLSNSLKIRKEEEILTSGIRTRIQGKHARREIQTEILSSNSIFFHLNYHYTKKIAESSEVRRRRFQQNYNDAVKITQKLEL